MVGRLKPCPFCGGQAYVDQWWSQNAFVCCPQCGLIVTNKRATLKSSEPYTIEEAIEAYNRRKIDDPSRYY